MRKHERTAASGLPHFGPSAVRTLHDVCNRRQNKYLLSQHDPDPSCSRKTNKHGLKLGCPAEFAEEFQILWGFCMRSSVQSKTSMEKDNIKEMVISANSMQLQADAGPFQTRALFTDQHSAYRFLLWIHQEGSCTARLPCWFTVPMPTKTQTISRQAQESCVLLARRTTKVGQYQQVSFTSEQKQNKRRIAQEFQGFLHQKSFSCGLRQPASQI